MRVEQKITNWTSTNVHLSFGQTVLIWALKANSLGGKVSSISIKTGSIQKAESDCKAVMEICDVERNCCQTSVDGRGLDNPGSDRQRGKTDVYTTPSLLGNCAQEVININECIHTANKHFVYQIQTVWLYTPAMFYHQGTLASNPVSAKLTSGGNNGFNIVKTNLIWVYQVGM